MKRLVIKASQDFDEWDEMHGKKYRVCGYPEGKAPKNTYTNDPVVAIKAWFKFEAAAPLDAAIFTTTKAYGVELLKAATPELLSELHAKHDCPYRLDYMIESVEKKINDNCRGLIEDKHGDQIHPFSFG